MKTFKRIAFVFVVMLAGPLLMAACGNLNLSGDWRTATRESARIAPLPSEVDEAIVQVWAGRAFRWRGIFAVHSWIATKERGADSYVVHDVMGWRGGNGAMTVASYYSEPDRFWYGAEPQLLGEVRGAEAEQAIEGIARAIQTYPHAREYVIWPGPNSNTFVAHVVRQVPELAVDLPPTAIGKDYLARAALVGEAPSNTGFQVSLVGALGVMLAMEEGLEVNLLGLTIGVDPKDFAIKLPGVGRLELP